MLLFLTALFWAVVSLSSAKTCNVTLAKEYQFECNVKGWVRLPDVLKKIKAPTAAACAKTCLSLPKCGSLRMIDSSSTCYLYRKHLEQMDTDFSNYLPGKLYQRECFSSDCNVISACRETIGCNHYREYDAPGYHFKFQEYACGYGVTAKPYSFSNKTISLDGSLTACEASSSCANEDASSVAGTFEVYFHIPSQVWICTMFFDGGEINHQSLDSEKVSYRRFTVKNESVGAGYAYWLTDYDYY